MRFIHYSLIFRLSFVVSHPYRKNKNAARMGHPARGICGDKPNYLKYTEHL